MKEEEDSLNEGSPLPKSTSLSVSIVSESKMKKLLTDTTRELGGRVYFEQDYDKYFEKGDERNVGGQASSN